MDSIFARLTFQEMGGGSGTLDHLMFYQMEMFQQEMANETNAGNLGGLERDVGTPERRSAPSLTFMEVTKSPGPNCTDSNRV